MLDHIRPRRELAVRDRYVSAPPMAASPEERPDFFDVVRKLWRHRFMVLACTLGMGLIGAVLAVRMPSYYVADARVMIGGNEPRVYNNESFMTEITPETERVQNETFVIQSRELAKIVIDQLQLAENPEYNPYLPYPSSWKDWLYPELYLNPLRYIPVEWRDRFDSWFETPAQSGGVADAGRARDRAQQRRDNRMVDRFLSKVDVATLGRSHVLSIQAESENPDTAAQVANTLAAAYLSQQRDQKIQTTGRVEDYLTQRIAQLRQQVEKSEQAVADYRRETGIYNGGANVNLTSQQISELSTQMVLAQTAKAEADSRLQEAQALSRTGAEGDSVPDVLKSTLIQDLKKQQAEAERKVAELGAMYGAQHPMLINARAQVTDITRKIRTEIGRVISGLRQEARTADARYQALQHNFDKLQNKAGTVSDKSIHLDALERDATVNRNLLEAMLGRAKEAVGRQELAIPDGRLISSAAAPELPSYPPKGLIAGLTLFGGFLIGVIAALMREGVDRTFRLSEQVEAATGVPVISMVPTLEGSTPPTVHVLRHPVSSFSEALRRIYVSLELSESETSPKTVMFCSAAPAEGKSVMVASLGRLLASNGKRVLLIDCDWRCPNLHRLFRCPNKGGLAALLEQEEATLNDIVYNDALSGLDLIPAGVWNPQSIHRLTSDRMRLILQTFAKNYDLVIIDAPPVLVGAEVLTMSRMVDKVAFVLRWGHTRREVAMEAMKQLIDAQGDLAGVVMSRVDPKRYRAYSYGNLNYEYVRPALSNMG
jgi:capsular exopolysaccharide synthesis family protein